MGKKKADPEHAPCEVVTDHGLCKECGDVVDVVVEIHQTSGDNKFICVDCRCKRILQKAKEAAGGIQEDAKAARKAAKQLNLPLTK